MINFRDDGWRGDSVDEHRLFYPTYYRVTNNYQVDNFLHFLERLIKQYLWQLPVFCIFWPAKTQRKVVKLHRTETACNVSDVDLSEMDERSNMELNYEEAKQRNSPSSSIWSSIFR